MNSELANELKAAGWPQDDNGKEQGRPHFQALEELIEASRRASITSAALSAVITTTVKWSGAFWCSTHVNIYDKSLDAALARPGSH
jgi:hypothetical protein